jgi:hypothetical protein
MPTTWKVLVDWDRNGNFTGADDDVTSRVLQAKWSLGSNRAYAEVANDSKLDLVLPNNNSVTGC